MSTNHYLFTGGVVQTADAGFPLIPGEIHPIDKLGPSDAARVDSGELVEVEAPEPTPDPIPALDPPAPDPNSSGGAKTTTTRKGS